MAPSVTVGGLLQSRPEALGLPLELLSGKAGLDRVDRLLKEWFAPGTF